MPHRQPTFFVASYSFCCMQSIERQGRAVLGVKRDSVWTNLYLIVTGENPIIEQA